MGTGASDGERKTVTALFADIQGSMDLMEDLDPEEAEAIIGPALGLMGEAVRLYGGHVVQSTGDGVFALFGAPSAFEDHATRALHAALRIQETIRAYAERLRLEKGWSLAVRIGVNTGEVVVRTTRNRDGSVGVASVGHAIGLAQRMESLATPGCVVVTARTYALTSGYFAFRPLGPARVKGVTEPVPLYQVEGTGPVRTRFERSEARGLSRFVGRRPELAALHDALAQALRGEGRTVAVAGEPGVGKSRLFHEFKRVAREQALVLEAGCVSHGGAFSYLPVVELVHQYCDIQPGDDERRRREKVTGKVLALDPSLADGLPYILSLLGMAEAASLQQMATDIRRRRTHEALVRLWSRESAERPLVVVVEDLHWLDDESEAFLARLAEGVIGRPVLFLVNYRPEYREEWSTTQVRIEALEGADARSLVAALLGESEALAPVRQLVLARAQGNPLYIEEIVQALVEQGVLQRDPVPMLRAPVTEARLPASVQEVLAARIDRLEPDAKALLQTLAVVGGSIPIALACAVTGESEETLPDRLGALALAAFLYEEESPAGAAWVFKHTLTQEAAYSSLLGDRRRALHDRTAHAIEQLYAARLEDHYGVLAHHYRRSGSDENAIEYLARAAEQAARRSAHGEAEEHLTAALSLLTTLPSSPVRRRRELALQARLGTALVATHGYAAPEVERAYARTERLCDELGDAPELMTAVRGLAGVYIQQGKLGRAARIGQALLERGGQSGDLALVLEARRLLGEIRFWHGEPSRAARHLTEVQRLYDVAQHGTHALRFGQDPSVVAQGFLGMTAWLLGRAEQARARVHALVGFAREREHPFSLSLALMFAAWVHQLRREPSATSRWAEALIAVTAEHGFPEWHGWGEFFRGAALVEEGRLGEGIADMEQGYAAATATGSHVSSSARAWLAEAYVKAARPDEALAVIDAECALLERTGARAFEAELHRVAGEALLRRDGPVPEAEACLRRALDVTRRSTPALGLRAATSLARFCRDDGRALEARELLRAVHDKFTEGFDTPDLTDARALLQALA